MPEGLGPRFVLEAAFLIVLAAVAAYARLDTAEILLVMAAGWLLASIFEVLAARRERLYGGASWERRAEVEESPAKPDAERRLSWFRRPEVAAAPPDESVAAASAPEESIAAASAPEESVAATGAPEAAEAQDESTGEIELPARRRRRWFRKDQPEQPLGEEPAQRPSARHVRLIKAPEGEQAPGERDDAESG